MSQMPPTSSVGMQPHRATMILVLGILSIFVCQIILGPIAWIMGNADLKAMAEGRMDPSGQSQTNTGKICGMVGTIIGVLGIIIWIGMIVLGLGVAVAGGAAGAPGSGATP